MIKSVTKSLFFLISLGTILCDKSCIYEDWLSIKDEKCFKVITEFTNNFEAQNVCQQNGGSLAVIRTEEEQNLVNQYLEKAKIVDNIWIDLKWNNNSFEWSDGTDMKYTNWVKNRPLNSSEKMECAVISVDLIKGFSTKSESFGKWLDVNCNKRNAILCQRIPPWSMNKIQKVLIETRRNYTDELEILKTQTIPNQLSLINSQKNELDTLKAKTIPEQQKLIEQHKNELDTLKQSKIPWLENVIESHKNELNNLKSNPVPIGFIYVQLSGQSEPKTLWPNTEWQHISGNYAGLFFRTEGGQSSPFGQIQEQQTHNFEISTFQVGYNGKPWGDHGGWQHGPYNILDHFQYPAIYTGSNSGGDYFGMVMKHHNEEVHPLNQAVRIWQRIK